jgi:hypothetical protein
MTDEPPESVAVLNTYSVVGIAVCAVLAVAALFSLPTLQEAGLSFGTAFWLAAGIELVTALGIAYFVLNLHEERA